MPFLEKEQAQDSWISDVRWYWEYPGKQPPELWMLGEIAAERVAIDGASHTLFERMRATKPEITVTGAIAQMRYLKTDAEIALTTLAAGYADFALEAARGFVANGLRDGISEIELVRLVQSATTGRDAGRTQRPGELLPRERCHSRRTPDRVARCRTDSPDPP